ncbi:cytochrome P450 [Haloparvum sp. PAK95]|uniref:cytochrome P450 n=1 Tax=Haloparvum sp. PAK95 TaxID=3418962 RepID=UPI003D2F2D0A
MRARPPGPRGSPLVGNARRYAEDPFTFMRDCADAYGDVVRFDLGPRETYMLTNPADVQRVLVSEADAYRKADFGDRAIDDLLGDGLLMSEGDTWKRQRQLANPAFNMRRISALADTMVDHTADALGGWADGKVVDLQLEIARLTVRIIVSAMFGAELSDERIRAVQDSLEPLGARFEPDPRRFLLPDWIPTRENREFDDAIATLEGVIEDVLAAQTGTQRDPAVDPAGEAGTSVHGPGPDGDAELPNDLLSILLRARDRGEQTERNLRDELMTMLLAGHDTTALTLTYTTYLLSEHPEVQRQVQAEVDEVLAATGEPTTGEPTTGADGADSAPPRPTLETARQLDLTERVIDEAMRLYPPVYALFRQAKRDVEHGGYRVPKDATLLIPQWVVHRSDRWYDDPETFDPDRWLPERRAERPRFAFFPFGGGPRHCIGKQFSLLEAKLILTWVYSRYDLTYEGPELSLRGSLTMHPDHPVPMRVEERS